MQGNAETSSTRLLKAAPESLSTAASLTFGRIPNIVTTTDTAYNPADGTPRFITMLKEYIERSGDKEFVLEMYPVVLKSMEGTLKYHTDSLGFLTHGDAETWMDAVGPDGPWSPRGNRANDTQALWSEQLEASIWFATMVGDPISAQSWHRQRRLVDRSPLVDVFYRQSGKGSDEKGETP